MRFGHKYQVQFSVAWLDIISDLSGRVQQAGIEEDDSDLLDVLVLATTATTDITDITDITDHPMTRHLSPSSDWIRILILSFPALFTVWDCNVTYRADNN